MGRELAHIAAGVVEAGDKWRALIELVGGESILSDEFDTEDQAKAAIALAREVVMALAKMAGVDFMRVVNGQQVQ